MNNRNGMPILITGIGGGGHGEQILKALCLSKNPYRIIGTDCNTHSSGKAFVEQFYQVPRANDPNYLNSLFTIIDRHEIKAVFHGSEQEMMVFSKHRELFKEKNIYLPINPPEVLEICQNKYETFSFLMKHNFNVPKTYKITSSAPIPPLKDFPVVIKPSKGGGGSANVFIAQNQGEFETFANYLFLSYPEFIVQEYVGTPNDEYTVGVLFGADGMLINSIGIKRSINTALSTRLKVPNKTDKTSLGPNLVISSGVSQGVVGRWPEVTGPCEKIAKALNPTAPINIQCRVIDNKVYPFEINPRFSGTTSLRAIAGYNEPDVLLQRDLLKKNIETHFSYKETVIMRGLMEQEV